VQDDAGAQLIALCFGATDPVGMARFWAGALRWEVGEEADGDVALIPTDGTRFTLRFVAAPAEKTGQNRQHLDLTTSSLADQAGSADQLVGLGGRHLDIGQTADEGHLVLADPEGNELCLIGPDNGFLADCPRLGAISCDGTQQVGYFWSAVLGWPLVWDQDEETAIRAPDGTGPMITWGGPPVAPKSGPNRLHLDVAPRASVSQEAEVDRLISLGASRADGGHSHGGGVAMIDPDGNEFCVLRPR
jgi:catechol 2,3-dioxygenase-like lactoylglutathione lyase family enzyme